MSSDDYRKQRREELRSERKARQFIDTLAAGQDDREDRRERRNPDRATRIPLRVTDPGVEVGPVDASIRQVDDREAYLRWGAEPAGSPEAGDDETPAFEAGAEGFVLPRHHPLDHTQPPSPDAFGSISF